MAIFEFELASVADISPWGKPSEQSLSWFTLTDGRFRMIVGDQVLFRYADEILSHWGAQSKTLSTRLLPSCETYWAASRLPLLPFPPELSGLPLTGNS